MKAIVFATVLLAGVNANAVTSAELNGRWKMTSYVCASGKPINFGSGALEKFNMDLSVTFSGKSSFESKIDYAFSFKQADIDKALKPFAGDKKALAEVKRMYEPKECSSISRATYYVRGNTLYMNELLSASTCSDPDTASVNESIELEAATVEVKENQLIVTGGREVEKGGLCALNDRIVITLEKQ